MLERRAVCAERRTYGSERRSREIVRLRPASYSTRGKISQQIIDKLRGHQMVIIIAAIVMTYSGLDNTEPELGAPGSLRIQL